VTTLSEAAYNVLNVITGGHSQNQERYSIEQIKYQIGYYRALLIRRDMNRNTRFDGLEQDLGLLPVEVADPADGLIGTWRGLVLRTIPQIPEPIRLSDRSGITAVTSPDFRYTFPVIEYHQARWQRYNQFTSRNSRAFLINNRVYLHTNPLVGEVDLVLTGEKESYEIPDQVFLEHTAFIRVRGIFEDPKAAWELANPGQEFDDDTTPYPLPKDMEQRIAQSLMTGEFKMITEFTHDGVADMLPDDVRGPRNRS
jgi:hypothetical protein